MSRHKAFDLLEYHGCEVASVLQVGAHYGQEAAVFRQAGVKWAVMVEPLGKAFENLLEAVKDEPTYIPVQALCAARAGVKYKFNVASNKGQSSSILKPTEVIAHYPKLTFVQTLNLHSTTVDDLLADVRTRTPELPTMDMLFIDVQGAELEVMKGATEALGHIKAIWSEVSYDHYAGATTPEELNGFLSARGFRMVYLSLNNKAWGDALWLRVG